MQLDTISAPRIEGAGQTFPPTLTPLQATNVLENRKEKTFSASSVTRHNSLP